MDRKWISDCQGLQEGASGEQLLNRYGGLFEVMKSLEVESSDDCIILCM